MKNDKTLPGSSNSWSIMQLFSMNNRDQNNNDTKVIETFTSAEETSCYLTQVHTYVQIYKTKKVCFIYEGDTIL